MIANNIFKVIGDFFTNVLFQPLEAIRFTPNWWLQNAFSWLLIFVAFGFFFYWLGQIAKYQKEGNE